MDRRHSPRLEAAKLQLRKRGMVVYNESIEGGRRGMVRVNDQPLTRAATIALAQSILDSEWKRNSELRARYGLAAPKRTRL